MRKFEIVLNISIKAVLNLKKVMIVVELFEESQTASLEMALFDSFSHKMHLICSA